MMRMLATAIVAMVANALGLIIAANVLDDMHLGAVGFTIAVLIFTGASILIEPLLRQVAVKSAPAVLGSSALITVLAALIITVLVSDSLTITGLLTWVLATVIIWAVAFAGRLLLPLIIFKKTLANANTR